jgi:predicted membrane protein (TIGR00267 family)
LSLALAKAAEAASPPTSTVCQALRSGRFVVNRPLMKPNRNKASRVTITEPNSALTIALSYVAGGLVPLAPYFLMRSVHVALFGSVIVTLLALFLFGFIKGRFTTNRPLRSAWQTVLVGGLAASAAFAIAKLIG